MTDSGTPDRADTTADQLRMPKMLPAIGAMIAVAVLLVSGFVLLGLWLVDFPGVATSKHLTLTNLFDLLKLAFAVVAGIGGVVALVVAYRRQQVAEDANRIAQKKNDLEHAADLRATEEHQRGAERLFHERFQKASEQLGHEAAAVRLAGVYAMASLADDWADHRQTCIDVLCAYLRMHFNPDPPDDMEKLATWHGERQVRQTVVRVITAHLRDSALTSWQGKDLDFTGAVFTDGDSFACACFSSGVTLFDHALFTSGNVSFSSAQFTGGSVSFDSAQFAGGRVIFDGALFFGQRVSFDRAKFTGSHVTFNSAEFADGRVSFYHTHFTGGSTSFSGAAFTGGTIFFNETEFGGGIVDLGGPSRWETPPVFRNVGGGPAPEGLFLPGGLQLETLSTVDGGVRM